MGNRGVLTHKRDETGTGIYLHWNGGRDSIIAFLRLAKHYKIRNAHGDSSYCYARLVQIIANFFGGTCSVGVGNVKQELDSDNGDNGMFIFDDEFNIVDTKYSKYAPIKYEDLSENEKEYCDGVFEEAKKKNDLIFNYKEN